jgi:hypothetical protein
VQLQQRRQGHFWLECQDASKAQTSDSRTTCDHLLQFRAIQQLISQLRHFSQVNIKAQLEFKQLWQLAANRGQVRPSILRQLQIAQVKVAKVAASCESPA